MGYNFIFFCINKSARQQSTKVFLFPQTSPFHTCLWLILTYINITIILKHSNFILNEEVYYQIKYYNITNTN